jgi:hypothetical protein
MAMIRAIALGVVFFAVACASTPSDYTPQINVVPGAASRSLWIGSKNAPDDGGAKAPVEGDASVEPPP